MEEDDDKKYLEYLKAIGTLGSDATGDQKAVQYYQMMNGLMAPEELKAMRQQSSIDALRERSMEAPQTKMYGGVAVAPSWTQVLGNVAQGLSAGYQQNKLDEGAAGRAKTKADWLGALMNRQGGGNAAPGMNDQAERQRNMQQYGVPMTMEEIRRRQLGLESL